MKKIFSAMATFALTVGMAWAAPSATFRKGTPTSADDAIWAKAKSYAIENTVVSGTVTGESSASWQGAYDDNYIYVLITVKDSKAEPNMGTDKWNGDAAEVYIRSTKEGTQQLAARIDGERYAGTDYYTVNVDNPEENTYRYFFKINGSNADKGIWNFSTGEIRLDVAVDFSANTGDVRRARQMSWGTDPYGNRENYKDTYGVVTLADATPAKIQITNGRTAIYEKGDFACLQLALNPDVSEDATTTYEWKKDGVTYTGKNYNNNNIRPTTPGKYTCVVTYEDGAQVFETDPVEITTKVSTDGYLRQDMDVETNLPILVIRTGVTALPNWDAGNGHGQPGAGSTPAKTKIFADMKVIWNGDGNVNRLSDMSDNAKVYYDRKVRINYRGSSSRTMAKRSLALSTAKKNLNESGEVKKDEVDMFDLAEGKDWILYSAYQDKSHMRNRLAMDIANEMGYYASHCKFVELYIDGIYQGVYVFMEKYVRNGDRINVSKLDKSGDAAKTGYVMKFDKVDLSEPGTWYRGNVGEIRNLPSLDGAQYHANYAGCGNHGGCGDACGDDAKQGWEMVYPDPEDDDTDGKYKQYIKDWLTKFDVALYNASTEEDFGKIFDEYVDLQSFVDFMIMEEFARNTDGYRISMFFSKDKDSKLKCIAPWDFEMGYGNSRTHGGSQTDLWQYLYHANEHFNEVWSGMSEPYYPIPFWWEKLMKSECFRRALKTRWEELRKDVLSKDNVWGHVDELVAELTAKGALDRDKKCWSWSDRNNCVTGYDKPPYTRCPWIIVPWGSGMNNDDGQKMHPIPTNLPKQVKFNSYTEDADGKKTLDFEDEWVLLEGWIADRLAGMDNLINALGVETLNEEGFMECAKAPEFTFTLSASPTELTDEAPTSTLKVKNDISSTADITYAWYKDDEFVETTTKATLDVEEPGIYKVKINIDRLGGIPTLYQSYETETVEVTSKKSGIEETVSNLSDLKINSVTVYNVLGVNLGTAETVKAAERLYVKGVNVLVLNTSEGLKTRKILVP